MGILSLIFELVWWVILLNIIMSWMIQFEVLNINQPMVQKVNLFLRKLTEPVYAPIRKLLPPVNGIDFSPMIVLIALILLRNFLGL